MAQPDRPKPVSHAGGCGRRSFCWRRACREAFGLELRTVEHIGPWLYAHCHRERIAVSLDLAHVWDRYWVELLDDVAAVERAQRPAA
jgi:hypothetical protein